jgi:hypothetical protein
MTQVSTTAEGIVVDLGSEDIWNISQDPYPAIVSILEGPDWPLIPLAGPASAPLTVWWKAHQDDIVKSDVGFGVTVVVPWVAIPGQYWLIWFEPNSDPNAVPGGGHNGPPIKNKAVLPVGIGEDGSPVVPWPPRPPFPPDTVTPLEGYSLTLSGGLGVDLVTEYKFEQTCVSYRLGSVTNINGAGWIACSLPELEMLQDNLPANTYLPGDVKAAALDVIASLLKMMKPLAQGQVPHGPESRPTPPKPDTGVPSASAGT